MRARLFPRPPRVDKRMAISFFYRKMDGTQTNLIRTTRFRRPDADGSDLPGAQLPSRRAADSRRIGRKHAAFKIGEVNMATIFASDIGDY